VYFKIYARLISYIWNNYSCEIIKTRNRRELGAVITFPPLAGSFAPRSRSLKTRICSLSMLRKKGEILLLYICECYIRSVIFSSLSKYTLMLRSGVQVCAPTFKMVPLRTTQASHTLKQVLTENFGYVIGY